MINLKKLRKQVKEALAKETKESLSKWLLALREDRKNSQVETCFDTPVGEFLVGLREEKNNNQIKVLFTDPIANYPNTVYFQETNFEFEKDADMANINNFECAA